MRALRAAALLWAALALPCLAENSSAAEDGDDGAVQTVRDEVVPLPFGYNMTVEVPFQKHGFRIGNIAAGILTILFFVVLFAMSVFFCFCVTNLKDFRETPQSVAQGYRCLMQQPEPPSSFTFHDYYIISNRLLLEALIGLALPWVALGLGCIWLAARGTAPPVWLLVLIVVPMAARACYVECCLVPLAEKGYTRFEPVNLCSANYVLSKLELVDAVSDGLAVVAAAALSDVAHERWVHSFEDLPPLQLLADWIGLGGALAVALGYATALQVLLALSSEYEECRGEMAGMGCLGRWAVGLSPERELFSGVARVMGEAAPQLLLQTSLLMAGGGGLGSHAPILISVMLTVLTLTKKTIEFAISGVAVSQNGSQNFKTLLPITLAGFFVLVGILALVVIKLYMIETCPDHLWNLSSGCMEYKPPL